MNRMADLFQDLPPTKADYSAKDIEVLEGLQPGEEVVVGPYQKLRKLSEWDRAVIDEKKQQSAISVRQP